MQKIPNINDAIGKKCLKQLLLYVMEQVLKGEIAHCIFVMLIA